MAEETGGAEVETGENFAKRSAIADLDLGNVYPILRSMLGFYDFIQCPGSQCDRTTLEEILIMTMDMCPEQYGYGLLFRTQGNVNEKPILHRAVLQYCPRAILQYCPRAVLVSHLH